jgi:hypothetical protein
MSTQEDLTVDQSVFAERWRADHTEGVAMS